jgi:hypothetical protein
MVRVRIMREDGRVSRSVNCMYDNHDECPGMYYTYRKTGMGYVGLLIRCPCECHRTE